MRILFVAHNFVRGNGQGRIQLEIARHALSSGHQVTLLADQVDAELLRAGAQWHSVSQWPSRPNLIGARLFAGRADRVLRRIAGEFDVVVGGGFTLRTPHQVNLCQFVHGAWIRSPVHVSRLCRGPYAWYQWGYSRLNSAWEMQAYRQAAVVVAPSEKIRLELLSIGVPADRVEVIHNGVDLDEFAPGPPERQPLRARLGLPEEGALALFVGDIRTPRKNLDTVLSALTRVPELRLVVAGKVEGSPFPAQAKVLGLADRVTFLDYRSDVAELMRACDVFVFPSRYEAGTLVLIEAAASGLPIVTARTAGGCEVLDDRAAVIAEDPNDADAIAAGLRALTSTPERRAAAARAAREIAERHSWARMADEYLNLFSRLARHAPAPSAEAP